MIRRILSLFRRVQIEANPRAVRWNEVRHLDENSAAKRRAITENRAQVLFDLRMMKEGKK